MQLCNHLAGDPACEHAPGDAGFWASVRLYVLSARFYARLPIVRPSPLVQGTAATASKSMRRIALLLASLSVKLLTCPARRRPVAPSTIARPAARASPPAHPPHFGVPHFGIRRCKACVCRWVAKGGGSQYRR